MTKGKKKIIILAYFFPPCNITASQRAYGWARYLGKFGYYPIIITRKWEKVARFQRDLHYSTSPAVLVEENTDYEVHYLPYKSTLRDSFFTSLTHRFWNPIRQLLSLIELIGQNYNSRFIPFYNFKSYASKLISNDSEIKGILATANPYPVFRISHELFKMHHIPWIADYRDDWTTRPGKHYFHGYKILDEWLAGLERKSEKEWLSSCSDFTTISDPYRSRIENFIHKKGNVVYNGYIREDFEPFRHHLPLKERFIISYVGTLIDLQEIEVFLDGFKRVCNRADLPLPIKLQFLGTGYDPAQEKRIRDYLYGYERFYEMTPRMEREIVISLQMQSQMLLMSAYGEVKGAPGTKTFDYLACERPILLCPSDNDMLETMCLQSGLGIIASNSIEVEEKLMEELHYFKVHGVVRTKVNREFIKQFSREHQAGEMAKVMDRYF